MVRCRCGGVVVVMSEAVGEVVMSEGSSLTLWASARSRSEVEPPDIEGSVTDGLELPSSGRVCLPWLSLREIKAPLGLGLLMFRAVSTKAPAGGTSAIQGSG